MRGIDCLQIPTTLLSQVDSSVGGKTAIDHDGIKNLVGTFAQPVAVVIDTEVLSTLPTREFISGFAEIIKHGFISDAKYLEQATSKRPDEFTPAELEDIIASSCRIKASVVESDETESGKRKMLNFGHTVGHALESLSLSTSTPLLHGEAISIGMVIEAELSHEQGPLSKSDAALVKQHLHTAGLPIISPRFETDKIIKKLHSDKKNEHGTVCFTLLESIGNAVWNQKVDQTAIVSALERNMEKQS
jgi:3-dehydroquinate synthase